MPIQELEDEWIHLFLYGRNGIGKTTFACHFPKPLALVALEMTESGGSRSARRQDGTVVYRPPVEQVKGRGTRQRFAVPVSQWLEQLCDELHEDETFQSVVIDHGSVLDEYILAEVCRWPDVQVMNRFKKVSNDEYTERSERMRLVLRPFFELKKHLVLVANEKDHAKREESDARRVVVPPEAQQGSFFSGAMGGGTTRWVQDASNWICQLFMDAETRKVGRARGMGKHRQIVYREEATGRYVRRLRMQYHPNFMARGRAEDPDSVPPYVGGEKPADLYNNFIAVVNGTYTPPDDTVMEETSE